MKLRVIRRRSVYKKVLRNSLLDEKRNSELAGLIWILHLDKYLTLLLRLMVLLGFPVCLSLACYAVTDLFLAREPTPGPSPAALVTVVPPTAALNATCPNLTADILDVARYGTTSGDGLGSAKNSEVEATYLVTYLVRGDRIGAANLESVPVEFLDERDDNAAHEAAWEYFTALIPADERSMLAAYVVITDGPQNILGAVSQIRTADRWALEIDIEDARDAHDLTYTLLHEFGHLLTLNEGQVPPSRAVFNNPDDDALLESEAAACPQYFPGEGCSNPGSYINKFYNRFWTGIHGEWLEIDLQEDQNAYEDQLGVFYRKYRDQFVSDYAVTSPAEDAAETWTYFVLDSKPDGDSIAEQKMLFFYEHPELVQLRTEILGNICESFPQ